MDGRAVVDNQLMLDELRRRQLDRAVWQGFARAIAVLDADLERREDRAIERQRLIRIPLKHHMRPDLHRALPGDCLP